MIGADAAVAAGPRPPVMPPPPPPPGGDGAPDPDDEPEHDADKGKGKGPTRGGWLQKCAHFVAAWLAWDGDTMVQLANQYRASDRFEASLQSSARQNQYQIE